MCDVLDSGTFKITLKQLNVHSRIRIDQEYERLARTISFSRLEEKDIRIAFRGESIPTNIFCDRDANVNNKSVVDCYFAGSTIVLQGANRFSRSIERMRLKLERNSEKHVHVNAYLTPPHSRGLGFHADDFDVAILHLYGQKNWLIKNLHTNEERVYTLKEGDCGYIPSPIEHSTTAEAAGSMHLTFGIGSKVSGTLQQRKGERLESFSPIELFNMVGRINDLSKLFAKVESSVDLRALFRERHYLQVAYPETAKLMRDSSKRGLSQFFRSQNFGENQRRSLLQLILKEEPQKFAQAYFET